MLLCTLNPEDIDLDLNLGLSSCEYVTPIFEGPRGHFISRHTIVQSRLTGGKSNVMIDYSIGFDSNFAEKLRALMNGESIQPADRDRVMSVLKLKANNQKVQFDCMPFLFENVRLARDNDKNKRPLNTLVAFRMLDHLNWDAFRADPTKLVLNGDADILKKSLMPKEEQFLKEQYATEEIARHEARVLGVQALLLRFATLWHAHKRDKARMWSELVDFCIFELGSLPMTELALIWCGMSTKDPAPFFGPITGKSKTMLAEIKGMAWDMAHLRILEKMASQSTLGSFFIPYFVSLDARWRNLLRLNPIRVMLVDDGGKSILFGRANEREFQVALGECWSDKAKAQMSSELVEARRIAAKTPDITAMSRLVEDEERSWQ